MHTCIPSHGPKRSWYSCPRWVNASNKDTPSMHHPRRLNVATSMVGLKKTKTVTCAKISLKTVNPRDKAGNAEEEGEPQRYSWKRRRRSSNVNLYKLRQRRAKTNNGMFCCMFLVLTCPASGRKQQRSYRITSLMKVMQAMGYLAMNHSGVNPSSYWTKVTEELQTYTSDESCTNNEMNVLCFYLLDITW